MEGLLIRRPVAPPVRDPCDIVPQPMKPTPPFTQPPPQPTAVSPPSKASSAVVGDDKSVVILEFQRQRAKELQEYFKQKKLEVADQDPLFGFIRKN